MNVPKQSYRIWHSNRSGSTYLCQLLESLGYAGKPGEHFTLHGEKSLQEKYDISNYEDLINKVRQIGTSPNGVIADKATGHEHYHREIISEICALKGIAIPNSYESVWNDIFPNCTHILIMRINRIRQAVSWWKAIQDNQWHLFENQTSDKDDSFYDGKYNLDALKHLYNEAMLRDIANQEYLVRNGLKFITVTYEALVSNTLYELNRILNHIGLPQIEEIPAVNIKKTSSSLNEKWVHKFKMELQENMELKVLS